MTLRMRSVLALVLAACGESEEENPPPISTGPSSTVTIGSGGSATDTDDTAATDASSESTGMPQDSSTGPPEEFTVIAGAFIQGNAAVNLPIGCRIAFYEPGQVEPSTGIAQGGFLFQLGGFTVDAYPQSFAIESAQTPMVEYGVEGYVVAECDADNDGVFDDDLVGYYPELPLQLVTVPASNIFIPISSM
jgi:hypothetical protein